VKAVLVRRHLTIKTLNLLSIRLSGFGLFVYVNVQIIEIHGIDPGIFEPKYRRLPVKNLLPTNSKVEKRRKKKDFPIYRTPRRLT
jgi:hypothetical protein